MIRLNELKESVRRAYNRENAWTARQNPKNYWLDIEKRKVSEMLPHKLNKALDLGCGRGDSLGILSEISEEVVALDFAEILLRYAMQRNKANPNVANYILGDAESLPFTSDSFDLVLAIQIIGNIPNPDLFLREINRVLKGGGTLILTTGNSLSFSHYVQTISQMAAYIKRKGVVSFTSNFSKFFSHDREFWIKEQEHARTPYFYLKNKLQRNGFKVQCVKGAGFTRSGIGIIEEIIKKMGSLIKRIDYRLSDSFPLRYCSSLIILKCLKS